MRCLKKKKKFFKKTNKKCCIIEKQNYGTAFFYFIKFFRYSLGLHPFTLANTFE